MKKTVIVLAAAAAVIASSIAGGAWAQVGNPLVDPNSVRQGTTNGKLEVTPNGNPYDGGVIVLGESASLDFVLRNGTNRAVRLRDVRPVGVANGVVDVVEGACVGRDVMPGASCSVVLEVKPDRLGSVRFSVLFETEGSGGDNLIRLPVTAMVQQQQDSKGKGQELRDLEMEKSVEFGKVPGLRVIFVRNAGLDPVRISSVTIPGTERSGFSIRRSKCPQNVDLLPAQQCAIEVMWDPRPGVSGRGDLVVSHSGPRQIVRTELQGTVEGGSIVSVEELAFEDVPAVRAVVFKNGTQSTLVFGDARVSGDERSGFRVQSSDCRTLERDATCSVLVEWRPSAGAFGSGDLLLPYKEGTTEKVRRVSLRGLVKVEDLVAAPASLDFGAGRSVRVIVLTNRSGATLQIRDVTVSGGSASGMRVTNNECLGMQELAPGGACSLWVEWSGERSSYGVADLLVAHSGPSKALRIELRGQPGAVKGPEPMSAPQAPAVVPATGGASKPAAPPTGAAQAVPAATGNAAAVGAAGLSWRVTSAVWGERYTLSDGTRFFVAREGGVVEIDGERWIVRRVGTRREVELRSSASPTAEPVRVGFGPFERQGAGGKK